VRLVEVVEEQTIFHGRHTLVTTAATALGGTPRHLAGAAFTIDLMGQRAFHGPVRRIARRGLEMAVG